jgi:hypothetical protein
METEMTRFILIRAMAVAFFLTVTTAACVGIVLVGLPHDGLARVRMMLVPFVIAGIGTALRYLIAPAKQRKNPWQQ